MLPQLLYGSNCNCKCKLINNLKKLYNQCLLVQRVCRQSNVHNTIFVILESFRIFAEPMIHFHQDFTYLNQHPFSFSIVSSRSVHLVSTFHLDVPLYNSPSDKVRYFNTIFVSTTHWNHTEVMFWIISKFLNLILNTLPLVGQTTKKQLINIHVRLVQGCELERTKHALLSCDWWHMAGLGEKWYWWIIIWIMLLMCFAGIYYFFFYSTTPLFPFNQSMMILLPINHKVTFWFVCFIDI